MLLFSGGALESLIFRVGFFALDFTMSNGNDCNFHRSTFDPDYVNINQNWLFGYLG
jgi:hypothetical protein